MKLSRNPIPGELVHTHHPALPILEIKDSSGYITTGKIFRSGAIAILAEVRVNMGRLIFSDGAVGWCNVCYLEAL